MIRLAGRLIARGLVACLLCAAPVVAQELQFSAQALKQDLAAIDAAIRSTHPGIHHSADEAELGRSMRAIEQRLVAPMTREAAWREFATLNPVLADGHLFVGFADWSAESQAHLDAGGVFFPFEVHVTAAGEVLVKSQLGGAASPLAGARIDFINGVDARTISKELLARVHGDTPAFRAALLSRRWWFFYWKLYGARTGFDLVFSPGPSVRKSVPGSSVQPEMLAAGTRFERQFSLALLPQRSALLTVNTFSWPDKPRFLEFTRDAFSKIREAGVQTLVIDIRANGGGNDDMWMDGILPYVATKPYRWASGYKKKVLEGRQEAGQVPGDVVSGVVERWIQPEPAHPLRYAGKVYVLVGCSTYSSAVLFSNVVQDFGFGVVAGTGGCVRASQSGGVQRVVLPNTGLVVFAPRFVLTRPSGATAPEWVEPDVPVRDDPLRARAAVEALLLRSRIRN
jgi:hypothetical protein